MAPPDALLVAPFRRAVEPLIRAPENVQSARISRIGMIDRAVIEHERAHARPLARVSGRVRSAYGRARRGSFGCRTRRHLDLHRRLAPVVVLDPLALLIQAE